MKARVLTALLLAPIVLLALTAPGWMAVAVLAWILAVLGGWEIGAMTRSDSRISAAIAGILGLSMFGPGNSPETLLAWGGGLFVVGVLAARFASGVSALFATGWVVGPMYAVVALARNDVSDGWHWRVGLLGAVLAVWAGDIAAIFAGKAFGKRPLMPKVSPKKTVEGAVASLVATALVYFLVSRHPVDLAIGALVSVVAQSGDLFESAIKRRAGVKDSGSLLPGHGGIMDRIDSLLFAFGLMALTEIVRKL